MFIGKILDPIHGSIELTEIEKWIMQQKIFSRLRRVRQNTLLNLVFPGANHTRFEHSIGVMHLATSILNESSENVTRAKIKEKNIEGLRYILDDVKDRDLLIQEVRLAALLHDVGHGPTSHKFDDFTIKGRQLIKILESDNDFTEYLDRFRKFLSKLDKNGRQLLDIRIEHELVSCVFIIKLIKAIKRCSNYFQAPKIKHIVEEISIDNIIKMIEPSFDKDYEIIYNEINYTDYLGSIISSFPIDADRMDYLFRDSFYSGVTYGVYDKNRVLNSLVPVEVNKRVTMGVKSSGLDSIIRFIQSRNHLYNQVYFHKTNTATNSMLDFVFRKLNSKSVMESAYTFDEFEDFYWKNSDEYFFTTTLKEILDNNGCGTCGDGKCVENEVREELLERKLWKRIFENRQTILCSNFKDYKKDYSKAIIELERQGIYIQVYYCQNEGLKGVDKSKIVILDKLSNYEPTSNWRSFNKELEYLNMTNTFITRVYLRKSKHENDYEETKERVLEKLANLGLIKR